MTLLVRPLYRSSLSRFFNCPVVVDFLPCSGLPGGLLSCIGVSGGICIEADFARGVGATLVNSALEWFERDS